ncbi:hypothetical protein SBRY_20300 [Actinacidiphila bryophytorum]|uniref:Uncharacterized protein n=1 Tax=Actinacidiphila bryophytorum TaxID=1436133 RepID=A0A9W4EDC3_9ACTN|nr:hypothetical protein SBRY_20300 [Actinacidiphila bryophytorum]
MCLAAALRERHPDVLADLGQQVGGVLLRHAGVAAAHDGREVQRHDGAHRALVRPQADREGDRRLRGVLGAGDLGALALHDRVVGARRVHGVGRADQLGLGVATVVLARALAQLGHHAVGELLRVLHLAVGAAEGQQCAGRLRALDVALGDALRVGHAERLELGDVAVVEAQVVGGGVVGLLVVGGDRLGGDQLVLLVVAAAPLVHHEEDAGADRDERDDGTDDDPGALAAAALRRHRRLPVAVTGLLRHLPVGGLAGLLRVAVAGLRLAVRGLLRRLAVRRLRGLARLLRVAVSRLGLAVAGLLRRLLAVRVGRLLAVRVRRRLVVAHWNEGPLR